MIVRSLCCLVALVLVVLLLAGCDCPEGCTTTVTCVHSFYAKSYTETVDGCWARCKSWYEKASQNTWCPDD